MPFLSKLIGGKKTEQQVLDQHLYEAVSASDRDQIKILLDSGANINAQNADGMSMLCHALINKEIEKAKLLVEYGADVELAGSDGITPLMIAVMEQLLEGVRLLLNAGANPGTRFGSDKDDYLSAIDLARQNGFAEICELLEANNSLDKQIIEAASRSDRDRVHILLDEGANVNAQNSTGQSLLNYALNISDVEMTKLLIERGADVELAADDGMTPLMIAVFRQFAEGVRLLLTAGANPGRKVGQGEEAHTAIDLAEARGNREIINLLVDEHNRINLFVQKLVSEDPMLVQAKAAALQNLRQFIKMFNERDTTPGYVFSVKVPIEDENGREHLWLMVYEINDQFILGTVGNDPTVIKNFKYGEAIQSPYESVEDIIVTDSEMRFVMGGHTLKAMIDRNNP